MIIHCEIYVLENAGVKEKIRKLIELNNKVESRGGTPNVSKVLPYATKNLLLFLISLCRMLFEVIEGAAVGRLGDWVGKYLETDEWVFIILVEMLTPHFLKKILDLN